MMEEDLEIIESRDHSIESQINLIMNSFPFEEVHKIFLYMNYKYMIGLDSEYTPNVEDLKTLAESLLADAAKKGKEKNINMTITSGRFEAFWENDEGYLTLKFVPYDREILFNEEDETIFTV